MPNVVVIGGGMAGATAARELAKKLPVGYTIIVIEKGQAAFWPPAALRAAVAPGEDWETKVVLRYDRFWPQGSPHKILTSTRVERLDEQAVVLESGEKVDFEYAVLATGSEYAFPFRAGHPLTGGEVTYDATVSGLKSLQEAVKAAKHILVVGGGTVGVEFAGEVGAYYSSSLDVGAKKVTLVSRGKDLCGTGYGTALPAKLKAQLERMKVNLILGDSVDIASLPERQSPAGLPGVGAIPSTEVVTQSGAKLEDVDFVLIAVGPDAKNKLISDAAPGEVTRAGIEPDENLRLTGALKNYFVFGDAADLLARGVAKMIVPIKGHAAVVADNILSLIKSEGKATKLKTASAPPGVIIVTVGPRGGVFVTPYWTFGEWTASLLKSKSLFMSSFESAFVAAA